jgi:hypothetical protein
MSLGHTHEDIDACFGSIKRVLSGKHIKTLQDFTDIIDKGFDGNALTWTVVDVMVIPNYQKFLEGCILKIENLHKELQTQHQWRFEAVPVTPNFPLGCKTTYRAYSSDKVVEFEIKDKESCITPVGRATGLEPCTVKSKWQPQLDPTSKRRVEGIYILRSIPHLDGGILGMNVEPMPFPDNARRKITLCLNEIHSSRNTSEDERAWWREWEEIWFPRTDNAVDYVAQIHATNDTEAEPAYLKSLPRYHVPLKIHLFSREIVYAAEWGSRLNNAQADYDNDFDWPEMIAVAQASVATEFNPHPPDPRLYSSSDPVLEASLATFQNQTTPYFDYCKTAAVPLDKLIKISNRIVTYTCDHLPTSNRSKPDVVNRFRAALTTFARIIHRPLRDAELFCVASNVTVTDALSEDQLKEVLTRVGSIKVTKQNMGDLAPGKPLSTQLMKVVISMFRHRDDLLVQRYHDINSRHRSFTPRQKSYFYEWDFFQKSRNADWLSNQSWIGAHRIYITLKSPTHGDSNVEDWSLLFLDIAAKQIYYLDSKIDSENIPEYVAAKLMMYGVYVNKILLSVGLLGVDDTKWVCSVYHLRYYQGCLNDCDSGMYVFMFLYFLSAECPLGFQESDVEKMRMHLAYWILNGGYLPY